MKPRIHRSYAAALLATFVLVMLPLAAALLFSAVQMHILARESRTALVRAADFGAQTRALRETLITLERSLRQGEVLGTPAISSAYEVHRVRVLLLARDLALQTDTQGQAGLEAARQAVSTALSQLDQAFGQGHMDEALEAFAALDNEAEHLIRSAQIQHGQTQRELSALPGRVSATVLWIAFAALPLAIALAFLFAWRLGRPIQHLGAAMRRLGSGDLQTRVDVRGPEAVAKLGVQLEWLRKRLVQLEQAREQLLRNMSHDLKTPLTAIAEGSALLDEQLYGTLNRGQRAVVALMAQNTARLGARIDALLHEGAVSNAMATPSSVDGFADSATLVPSRGAAYMPFDLAGVAQRVLEDHRLALTRRRLVLAEVLTPVAVVGDVDAIRVAIDNLVSNAVKFSPEGGTLRLAVQVRQAQAQVVVSDDGPGLTSEEAQRIFSAGVRGSAAAGGQIAGSGHGLAITREIAHAHGGRVWAEPPGRQRGATFVLALPLLDIAHAQAA